MSIDPEIDPPQTAHTNMQKDEALFAAQEAARQPQIHLRFYSWLNPAVSFGYAQKPEKLLDLNKAEKLGVETVKRITGGGMVFHQPGELTYAFTAPLSALPEGIIPSCNFISEIFIRALQKIGVKAELAVRAGFDGAYLRDICFALPAKYEVVCNGKKLLGSAQKRGRRVLLQHGSLALEPPLPVFAELADLTKLNQTNIRENMHNDMHYNMYNSMHNNMYENMHNYTYKELAAIIGAEFSALSL